jgi:hypothetical protein
VPFPWPVALQVFEEAIELCNTKSVAKGISKLVEVGYLAHTPEDVVAFIRLAGDRLMPREVSWWHPRARCRAARACKHRVALLSMRVLVAA